MESSGETPASNAEKVFRDLVCRAAFNNLKSVLRPVLLYANLLFFHASPSSARK